MYKSPKFMSNEYYYRDICMLKLFNNIRLIQIDARRKNKDNEYDKIVSEETWDA